MRFGEIAAVVSIAETILTPSERFMVASAIIKNLSDEGLIEKAMVEIIEKKVEDEGVRG